MFNILKKFVVLSIVTLTSITAVVINVNNEGDFDLEQPSYIESMKLGSSRYTRVDDLSLVDPDYNISIRSGDDLIAENDNLRLYYDEDIISFKIENKNTGYVFATHINNVDAGTYDGLLSGGLGIEYITVTKSMNIRSNVGIADIAFTQVQTPIENGLKIELSLGGYCATRNCKRLYPLYLEGRYTLEQMIEFGFTELNINFDLIVTLESDGIKAQIPYESIEENDPEEVLLSSIIVFPGLGATRLDEIPGYMVIPDGAGALVRYEDNEGRFKSPYEARFYGVNYGLTSLTQSVQSYPLSMPIFGMVHGVNQNAVLGIIESGDINARLLMYQNGAHNIDYNLVFPKFDYRQTYRQSFTSDGSGGAIRNIQTMTDDIQVLYKVLDDEEANYVGIGNRYREYLEEKNILEPKITSDNIPLHLSYLMADSKKSFFGTSTLEMSSTDDVLDMHNYFISQGIADFEVSLMGWNDGGYSGQLPSKVDFDNSLGSNKEFRDLLTFLQESARVSLINNYGVAGTAADSFSSRRDLAKGINRFPLTIECEDCVYGSISLIYPESSVILATDHLEDYQDLGVNVLFENIGNTIFSYYSSGYFQREDSLNYYMNIFDAYDGFANYKYPFAYAYAYTEAFMNAPLYNSQLKYFDDLVPLLQIVLKGNMPMYSDYLNFNSFGIDQLLTLIDFGVYPSFVLSMNESSLLKDTDLEYIFTSEFDLWKDTVVFEYNYINDALKHVIGEPLVAREVIMTGLVKNTYANGKIIYVNYTSTDKVVDSITVDAFDYYVGGGN